MQTLATPLVKSTSPPRAINWVYTTEVPPPQSLVMAAWNHCRHDRLLHRAAIWTCSAWLILALLFVAWVHYYAEGKIHHALLPGAVWGLPDREAAAGMQCVCVYGYDGEAYYWQSNDVFGLRDAYKHIDEPVYRYQRIAMSAISGGLAKALGCHLTPPSLHVSVLFGFAMLGFGGLVYWLSLNGLTPLYALGWLLSAGVWTALWTGTLDAAADGLFVLAVLAALSRRMVFYVPVACLLLLTRETYCLYALAIFLVTAAGKFDWSDVGDKGKRIALAALPGVLMLAWTLYISINFGKSPFEARDNVGFQGIPVIAMFANFGRHLESQSPCELRLLLLSVVTLLTVMVFLVRGARRLPWALLCALPCLLLVSSMGNAIWLHSTDHTRVVGAATIVGLVMLPFDNSVLIKCLLLLQAVCGVDMQIERRIMPHQLLSPLTIREEPIAIAPVAEGDADNLLLNDLRSRVEWVDAPAVCRREYRGFWSFCHREMQPIAVAVTNHSDVTWERGRGEHPIFVGYRLFDATGEAYLTEHAVIIDKPIAPGETLEIPLAIELRGPHREYVVEFSMKQAGPGWFVAADPDFGTRHTFRVE